MRKLCDEKKVEILEAGACPDHSHMLVSIPPYLDGTVRRGSQGEKCANDIRPSC